jgi:hypothetical protein
MEKRTVEIDVPVCDCCGNEAWTDARFLVKNGRPVIMCEECDETNAEVPSGPPKAVKKVIRPRKKASEEK